MLPLLIVAGEMEKVGYVADNRHQFLFRYRADAANSSQFQFGNKLMIAGIISEGVKNGVCFQELQSIAMVVKALFQHLHCAFVVSDVRVEDALPAWPIGFARVPSELF